MEKEVIEFNGHRFTRYPNAKCSSDRNYYKGWARINGKLKKITLHRYKWMVITGKTIPKGFDIHHVDEDFLNNDFSNYELKDHAKHMQDHYKTCSDELKAFRTNILLTKAQEAAKIWHKSDEGRAWHSGEAKKNFAVEPTEKLCIRCKKPFIQTHLSHTTYCSPRCSNAYRAMIHRQRYPRSKKVA